MLHSAEIRWFMPGQIPQAVLDWFGVGQALKPEKKRIDEYLMFPDCDTVGVKLREGKLEVKASTSPPRPLNLDLAITGRTDQWVKWSFDAEGLKALAGDLRQSGEWVPAEKVRYLRKWSADSDPVVEVPATERPDKGCNVELTSIDVNSKASSWYSIGFEAFGPPAANVKTLDETLRRFFKTHDCPPGVRLSGRDSMNYLAWLATVA